MSNDLERELAIADAEMRAATARRYAALLSASPGERGCSEPICPGPKAHPQNGCPLGYAGSCRRSG